MRTADGATVLRWPEAFAVLETCGGGLDEDEQIALWRALGVWWRAGGLRLGFEPRVASPLCGVDAFDRVVAIERVTTPEAWRAEWGPAASVIGFTIHTHDAAGTLQDADLVFNDASFLIGSPPPDGGVDLGWLAAHELGHALGLGHPCGEAGGEHRSCFELPAGEADAITGALMFPSTPVGAREPALGADDLAAVRALLDAGGAPLAPAVCLDAAAAQVRFLATASEPRTARWIDARDGAGPRQALDAAGSTLPIGAQPGLVEVRDEGSRALWIGAVASCVDEDVAADVTAPDRDDASVETRDASTDAGELDDTVVAPRAPADDCACRLSTAPAARAMLPASMLALLLTLLGAVALRRGRSTPQDDDGSTRRP